MVKRYIEHYTKPGNIVLDAFAGTGMTGVAAMMSGRNAILCEISPACIHIARNYTTPIDPKIFQKAYYQLREKIEPEIKPLYKTKSAKPSDSLFKDLRSFIIEARKDVARSVNSALVILYWKVGQRIRQDILKEKRAEYGEEILSTLSRKLVAEFGSGFTARNLANMVRFAEVFQGEKILHTLCAKLSWSHFRLIIYLDDDLKRDFYAEMCRLEGWSVRTLEKKIAGMLFERTALSKKPEKVIREELDYLRSEDKLTPDLVFRDPYFLDFLGLKDSYSEKDLETVILRELESFILSYFSN
ncbi:MAG: hypothetical protein A2157_04580 [Deltaproteobacteria bacterium RBG_16_47_11]|nr:MAG: hypothetical protein A2157_04580 [Deltaproteobacteria bacterium RBG_16_47_11]